MAVKEILQVGHPVLKKVSEPVKKIDKQILILLNDLVDTMYHSEGVGLAAPQIGVNKRVVVIDIGDDTGLLELINPEIISYENEVTDLEGCLSVLGMVGDVCRYEHVVVQAVSRQGKRIRVKGSGLLARALQHEIDHLDGKLYIDKAMNVRKVAPPEPEFAEGDKPE